MSFAFEPNELPLLDEFRINIFSQKWQTVFNASINKLNLYKYNGKPISSVMRLGSPYGHSFLMKFNEGKDLGDVHLTFANDSKGVPIYRLDILPTFPSEGPERSHFLGWYEEILVMFLLESVRNFLVWKLDKTRRIEFVLPDDSTWMPLLREIYLRCGFKDSTDGKSMLF